MEASSALQKTHGPRKLSVTLILARLTVNLDNGLVGANVPRRVVAVSPHALAKYQLKLIMEVHRARDRWSQSSLAMLSFAQFIVSGLSGLSGENAASHVALESQREPGPSPSLRLMVVVNVKESHMKTKRARSSSAQ
jgi:hypothetical protein